MAGLLEALDSLTVSLDLSADIDVQVGQLDAVSVAVNALSQGPTQLGDLQSAIDALPVAPALDGLGQLAAGLSSAGVSIPDDPGSLLSALTDPLDGLGVTLEVGASGQVSAAFQVLREAFKLITGRSFGGPLGMPDGDGFPGQRQTSLAEIEAMIQRANEVLDDFGPAFDAGRLVAFLQQLAVNFDRLLVRFPQLPFTDVVEALASVQRWQQMPAPALTAHLAATLDRSAQVIRMPHDKLALPLLQAAAVVARGPDELAQANRELAETFAYLRPRIEAGAGRPGMHHIVRLERVAARLAALADGVHHQRSPLVRCQALACDLLTLRTASLRALEPQCGFGGLSAHVEATLDGLFQADPAPFDEVVATIEEFDLSALTDPLTAVRDAVNGAVQEIDDARDGVRDQLMALLQPVADGLGAASDAAAIGEVEQALDDLPATIQGLVDDQILPAMSGIQQAIADALGAISGATEGFDPEALVAPIQSAVADLAALANDPAVQSAFADVDQALTQAIDAIAGFDLSPAADEAIAAIGDVELTLSEIDPDDIPDIAKPVIAQAVEVVAGIEFSVEVAAPLSDAVSVAIEAGPDAVLKELEGAMDSVRMRVEAFRPSALVAGALDAPFQAAIAALDQASPAALLGRVQQALDGVQDKAQVLDVGAVVDPLEQALAEAALRLEALRPSNLLAPLETAIEAAVEKVYAASGVDDVFEGLDDILEEFNRWTGLIRSLRDVMQRVAALAVAPGDAEANIDAIVEEALARLDGVDMGALQAGFEATAQAVQLTERDVIAGALAPAMRQAAAGGRALAAAPELARLGTLLDAFPLDTARGLRPRHQSARVTAAVESIKASAQVLAASAPAWAGIADRLDDKAGTLQADLRPYHLCAQGEGAGVLDSFVTPPAGNDALKAQIREALVDGLTPSLSLVFRVGNVLAPHAQGWADGFARVLSALEVKMDALLGDGGVGGSVAAIEEAVNLLRDIDLSPLTDPLDAVWAQIEGVLGAVDPSRLRAALEAARDAIAGLLDLSTLLDPGAIDDLEATFQAVVDALASLAPGELLGEPLDAEYEALLANILPVLELPARLRAALQEAGASLSADITIELARVEEAFDAMLRAIPVSTGVEVNVSASVSLG